MGLAGHHHEGIVNSQARRRIRLREGYRRWWEQDDNDLEVGGGEEGKEAGPGTEEWGGEEV